MIRVLEQKREAIANACRRHGVARMHVIGSALRDRDVRAYLRDIVDCCASITEMLHDLDLVRSRGLDASWTSATS